jgi:uncharacterized protein (DUF433 family)
MTSISIALDPVPLKIDNDGVIRVADTRITLDVVVGAFLDGATAEEIAQQYPVLELADIYAIIGYYLRRRSEVDIYVKQRQKAAQKIRKQNESRFPPQGIRARLLARRQISGE